ncbi:hypothetical protein G3I44_14195 [Halogeometricum borinquense]|uniref:Uncharacterized protein n=1 Tax=Halogeometricum borinquense TaxID=60847 RepID=A0A6C0UIJ0_9EURY|nr:hypothetical protein [Halogeometricum borinquense]QIB75336.1 hypothetical protein G3I44_14195 [Halogeometricum borinquense]
MDEGELRAVSRAHELLGAPRKDLKEALNSDDKHALREYAKTIEAAKSVLSDLVGNFREYETFEQAAAGCFNGTFDTISSEIDWDGLAGRTIYRFDTPLLVFDELVGRIRVDDEAVEFYKFNDSRQKLAEVARSNPKIPNGEPQ